MSLALVWWALTGSSAYSPVPDLPVPDKKAPLSTEVIAPMFDGRAVRARAPTPTGAMWAPQAQKAAQQEADASGGSPRSGADGTANEGSIRPGTRGTTHQQRAKDCSKRRCRTAAPTWSRIAKGPIQR